MPGKQLSYPEYENFLESLQRQGGAFKFVTTNKEFPIGSKVGTPSRSRSLNEIEQSVMESSRVKNVIAEESLNRGCSEQDVRKEALEILQEMSHQYSLLNVRAFGYAVCKVMELLYDGIYINEDQLKEIRELSKNDPIIFMPSHRTYFDFILLSLICFEYNIQLPAIAAGMDFLHMKLIGKVLRRSGAFFIRRSFGDDKLYWAVFSEYVQTHVINNDRSIEFFVEGTRSRVGKSLHPKYGMLQIVLEPYLRGSVYDMVIVPVSMNYDKILEEKLYAYELLGFPKPKESTSGMLKAREVLKKKHGSCCLTFGKPISVRDYFGMSLHRNSFVCQPDSQFVLDQKMKKQINKFAHYIIDQQNKNSIITVWNVACTSMLLMLDNQEMNEIDYIMLLRNTEDLIYMLSQLNTIVHVRKSTDVDLRYYLQIHNDLFEQFDLKQSNFKLKLAEFAVAHEIKEIPKQVMEKSINPIILTSYSNGMMHSIFKEGLICTLLQNETDVNTIRKLFSELLMLTKREFVTIPGDEEKYFENSSEILLKSNIIRKNGDKMVIVDWNSCHLLQTIVRPYINNVEHICKALCDNQSINMKAQVRIIQEKICKQYTSGKIPTRLSFLSTEPIKNTLKTLQETSVIDKKTSIINHKKLENVLQLINKTKSNSLSKM